MNLPQQQAQESSGPHFTDSQYVQHIVTLCITGITFFNL